MAERRWTAEDQRELRERRRRGEVTEVAPSARVPRPRVDRLVAALAGAVPTPDMPEARCRGRADLFDEAAAGEEAAAVEYRHRRALQLCGGCPELARCTSWIAALPRKERPGGVVAGRITDSAGAA
jgi:hypothetical protein